MSRPERGRWVLWLPGLVVALGAAAATAHGLYEVAGAARVPAGIAWIYPLITDGLAVVAYTATARLTGSARRYAWSVVVLSAGLSGLAQAVFLATDPTPADAAAGAVEAAAAGLTVPAALRFGIGAWPAIAAALAAHLLHLLAAHGQPASNPAHDDRPAAPTAAAEPERVPALAEAPVLATRSAVAVQAAAFNGAGVQADALTAPLPLDAASVQPRPTPAPPQPVESPPNGQAERPAARAGDAPARDRAQAAAARLTAATGALPTVSELEAEARVSRGTAATVLKALREHPAPTAAATTAPTTTDQETSQR